MFPDLGDNLLQDGGRRIHTATVCCGVGLTSGAGEGGGPGDVGGAVGCKEATWAWKDRGSLHGEGQCVVGPSYRLGAGEQDSGSDWRPTRDTAAHCTGETLASNTGPRSTESRTPPSLVPWTDQVPYQESAGSQGEPRARAELPRRAARTDPTSAQDGWRIESSEISRVNMGNVHWPTSPSTNPTMDEAEGIWPLVADRSPQNTVSRGGLPLDKSSLPRIRSGGEWEGTTWPKPECGGMLWEAAP